MQPKYLLPNNYTFGDIGGISTHCTLSFANPFPMITFP